MNLRERGYQNGSIFPYTGEKKFFSTNTLSKPLSKAPISRGVKILRRTFVKLHKKPRSRLCKHTELYETSVRWVVKTPLTFPIQVREIFSAAYTHEWACKTALSVHRGRKLLGILKIESRAVRILRAGKHAAKSWMGLACQAR